MQKLYFQDKGSGKVVILLPGLLASSRYWLNIGNELVSKGYRVISIDQLGFGKSPKPDCNTDYSIEDNLKYYKNLFAYLNINKVLTIVGYSSSCVIAINLIQKEIINPQKIVLISPAFFQSEREAIIALNKSFKTYKYMMTTKWKYFFIPFVTLFRPILIFFAPLFITHVEKNSARDAFSFTWKSLYKSINNLIIKQNTFDIISDIDKKIKIIYATTDNITSEKVLFDLQNLNNKIELQKVQSTHQIPLEKPEIVINNIES
jgi:pimeloyl-ACP methyl ester carboxylesterase